jgi:hypothetical protein
MLIFRMAGLLCSCFEYGENTGSVTHPAETSLLISSDYFQILNRLL